MPLKITGLQVDNYKRITVAKVDFDPTTGGVVALMGENEQGKSSFLDALEATLAGRKTPKQAMPIHKGADSASIIATFLDEDGSEIVVTRRYTAKGTTIEARQNGLKSTSPDEIYKRLFSHVAIDPLAFAQLDSKKQTETLLALIGFDPTALDKEAADVYATRTEVGREVDRLDALVKSYGPEDAELAATPLIELPEVQDEIRRKQQENATREQRIQAAGVAERRLVAMEDELEQMEALLAKRRQDRDELAEAAAGLKKTAEESPVYDIEPLFEKVEKAADTNDAIRNQIRRAHDAGKLANVQASRAKLTARLDEIAKLKADGFAKAKMPIPGLTVEDGEVYLDGTPFSQTSAGGKLRTSTAIAMALNPDLRAIIIRDGSLLDKSNRAIIDELAKANDFMVLMEIVDETAETGVIFEDGKIREVRA